MCLHWGVCVPVPPGSCWGGTSGFVWELCCLQDTSLGARPRLCLFSLWGDKPSGALVRAGADGVDASQICHLGWAGRSCPQGIPVHLSALSAFVRGDKPMAAPPLGLGELRAVPQPGLCLQGTEGAGV